MYINADSVCYSNLLLQVSLKSDKIEKKENKKKKEGTQYNLIFFE